MSNRKIVSLTFAVLAVWSYVPSAHAYVDPGMTYMLLQGLFVAVFGGVAAWVIRPWVYLKSLFKKDTPTDESNAENADSETDTDLKNS